MKATENGTPASGADSVTHSHRRDAIDHQEVVETKARQLRALLYCTYGCASESFRQMSNVRQDEYLWACSDMADDIVASLDALADEAIAERKAKGVHHG